MPRLFTPERIAGIAEQVVDRLMALKACESFEDVVWSEERARAIVRGVLAQALSAQTCGCDLGEGHLCERHRR